MRPRIEFIRWGVTRWVLLVGPWAIKFPKGVRGWLGNESEWKQQLRQDVNEPLFTLAHFAIIFRRASMTGGWEHGECPFITESEEEAKPDAWGLVNGNWVLIDFDKAWAEPRSFIGRIYYWNQERLARKWLQLPVFEEEVNNE